MGFFCSVPWLLQRKLKGCKGEWPIKKKSRSLGTLSKVLTSFFLQFFSYKPKENPWV